MTNKISFCTEPWTNLFLRYGGRVQPCCMNSTHLGDIHTDTLDQIWNGTEIQRIRKLVKEHKYEEAGCKKECAIIYELKKNNLVNIIDESISNNAKQNKYIKSNIDILKKDLIKATFSIQSKPIKLDIQPTEECNMSCIMCHQNHNNKQKVEVETINKLFQYKQSLASIRFQGGEIFIDNKFSKYLVELKKSLLPTQIIQVITNGSILSFSELDLLTQGNNPVEFIISMDATDAEIYQNIRQTPHFLKVKNSIEYLSKLQKSKNNIDFITWNYIIMKSNFYNIKDAIKLSLEYDVKLKFGAIIGSYKEENIFDFPELREERYINYLKEAIYLTTKSKSKVYGLEKILEKLA